MRIPTSAVRLAARALCGEAAWDPVAPASAQTIDRQARVWAASRAGCRGSEHRANSGLVEFDSERNVFKGTYAIV